MMMRTLGGAGLVFGVGLDGGWGGGFFSGIGVCGVMGWDGM